MTSKPCTFSYDVLYSDPNSREQHLQHVNKLISLPFLSLRFLQQLFRLFHFQISGNGSVMNGVGHLSCMCLKEIGEIWYIGI